MRLKELRKGNANYGPDLVDVPKETWPPQGDSLRFKVMRSRYFLVQFFNDASMTRLSVNRCSLNGEGRWSDEITWDELQEIKRQCGYGERLAVEIYPCDTDIVNVANMRHLWIYPIQHQLPFGWEAADKGLG